MNYVNWFEIPVKDMTRAMKFYSSLMSVDLKAESYGPTEMAVFPTTTQGAVHGALVSGEGYEPSDKGCLIYLNGGEDLAPQLAKVEPAGGKVIQDKMGIGEHGFIALFLDTEGNRVAIHSMK